MNAAHYFLWVIFGCRRLLLSEVLRTRYVTKAVTAAADQCVHLTVVRRRRLTPRAPSGPLCSLSPRVRIKWTWCARSAVALLCFSLQWLIQRVLLCGSRHFTHGYIKPVGGHPQATYRVCVSMHDSHEILRSHIFEPLVDQRFLSLRFLFPSLLSRCCGIALASMVCRSGRQTSSGAMTGLIHRSCRMKRPFRVNPFQRPQWEASLRRRALCSPDSARIWWKGTRESWVA